MALGFVLALASPQYAQAAAPTVRTITVVGGSQELKATLTINLDSAVTPARATVLQQELQTTIEPGISAIVTHIPRLPCQTGITMYKDHGNVDLQYKCYPTYATTQWGLRLSNSARKIIVGNVNEDGMRWWRNGTPQPKNAPHRNVSKYYVFHGSLSKMWNDDSITYQDYITFLHNVGSGGTGSVLFAGSYSVG